jgi:hypothetical protein
MGTRHGTIVLLDHKIKVAQYGQWDGYPEGQGKTVATFIMRYLQDAKTLTEFKSAVRKCRWLSDKWVSRLWKNAEDEVKDRPGRNKRGENFSTSDILKEKYPQLSRDIGAEILQLIMTGEWPDTQESEVPGPYRRVIIKLPSPVRKLDNQTEYLTNTGGDIEWCWVLDLDNKILYCFNGLYTKFKFSWAEIPFKEVRKNTMEEWQASYERLQRKGGG